jgi:hypothetical protein
LEAIVKTTPTGTTISVVFLTISGFLSPALAQELYLVGGTPTPKRPAAFDTTLYRLDGTPGGITKVLDLVPPGEGSDFVHTLWDRRLMVVGWPNFAPTTLSVVSFDNPGKPTNIGLGLPQGATILSAPLLDLPGFGATQGFLMLPAEPQAPQQPAAQELWGLTLSDAEKPLIKLPIKDLSYEVADGSYGGGEGGDSGVPVRVTTGGMFANSRARAVEPVGLRVPPRFRAAADEDMVMLVNARAVVAISRVFDPAKPIEPVTLYAMDRAVQKWREVSLSGQVAWVRGFGPWLAGLAAEDDRGRSRTSPGKEQRAGTSLLGRTADHRRTLSVSTDDIYASSGFYFPGELTLYNVQIGRSYSIHTGQGDSEILLIEGSVAYYRVNTALFRVAIGDQQLGEPVRIAADPAIAQVHWMFSGPK